MSDICGMCLVVDLFLICGCFLSGEWKEGLFFVVAGALCAVGVFPVGREKDRP